MNKIKLIITEVFVLTCLITIAQDTNVEELWKLYQSRHYDEVIEKAKPLLQNDKLKIDLNLILGRAYTDQGDFKTAIPFLKHTASYDKKQSWRKAWALGYLGTCYFALQDYDNSKKSTQECIDLNATQNSTKYAQYNMVLFGFDKNYKEWKTTETENFIFHFQNMDNTEMNDYISSRENAFRIINQFFNSVLPKKIDFFVWDSRADAKELLKINLGFAKPEICMVHSHYQQTLGHEMTHVISHYSTDIKIKTALINEGVSVCFDLTNQDRKQIVKDWIITNNKTITIEEIWTNWKNYPEELTYPLSGLFVNALIDNFGSDKFIEFFGNQTYENAKLVFGDELDKVINNIENEINTKNPH